MDEKIAEARDIIDSGDLEKLKRMIEETPELLNAVPAEGAPLLVHASFMGDGSTAIPNRPEIIKALLTAGADVDLKASYEENALHTAASSGLIEIVENLLDAGASIDAPGRIIDNGTALALATTFGFREIAELLVERGADIYNLRLAAGVGRLEKVKSYFNPDGTLKANAAATGPGRDPDEPTFDDPQAVIQRAFEIGCTNGHLAVTEFFLSKGIDVNALVKGEGKNWSFSGPILGHAILNGHDEIGALLKKYGAEV